MPNDDDGRPRCPACSSYVAVVTPSIGYCHREACSVLSTRIDRPQDRTLQATVTER